jgi:hypothetical protein
MALLSETFAQADDPIYKSGLAMSFHSASDEQVLDLNELQESLKLKAPLASKTDPLQENGDQSLLIIDDIIETK